jgi:hypothetical protein
MNLLIVFDSFTGESEYFFKSKSSRLVLANLIFLSANMEVWLFFYVLARFSSPFQDFIIMVKMSFLT